MGASAQPFVRRASPRGSMMVVRDMAKRTALAAALGGVVVAGGGSALAQPALPSVVGSLPEDTALALHAPRLGSLLGVGATLFSLWGRADPRLRQLRPDALLSLFLWGKAEDLPDPQSHGLDLDAPVVVRVLPDLQTAVVILPLLDGRRFRDWLGAIPAPSRVAVEFLGTPIDVLGPGTARPLACAVRAARAYCQVGESELAPGLAPLASHLGTPRATLGARPALARSWAEVSSSADWTVLARPRLLVRGLVRHYRHAQVRAARFASPERRADLARHLIQIERRSGRWVEHLDALALGVAAGVGGARISVVAELDGVGARRLSAALPSDSGRRQLRRWASTPALFSLFLHARPDPVARLGRIFGVDLNPAELDGSLAILALSVDGTAPTARKSSREPLRFREILSSAVAVGLSRGPKRANPLGPIALVSGLPSNLSSNVPSTLDGPASEEYRVFGRGASGRYAALRRWRTAQEMALAPPEGFFFATLDLGAVDASLAAARISRDHRAELQLVEQMRRRAGPMLDRLGRIRVIGNANSSRRQVRLRVQLGR